MSPADRMARRYGFRPGAGGGPGRPPPPQPVQPVYVPPPVAPANRGGLPIALEEKQLKVTLMLDAVKLLSPK